MPDELARAARRRAFVFAHAAQADALVPLPDLGDLRRYRLPGHGLLLIEAAPGADLSGVLRLARHLSGLGLSAPFIAASDEAQGLALIEDFGEQPASPELFRRAVDLLAVLHEAPGATALSLPALDAAALAEELRLFLFWYAPEAAPRLQLDYFAASFMQLWTQALAGLAAQPPVLVLGGFTAANLLLLPARQGVAGCGLRDVGAARLGPCAHDLASLLQDPAAPLPPAEEAALLTRYLAARPRLDAAALRRDYALLAAQLHSHRLGLSLRALRRDGDASVLATLPRLQTLLADALEAAGMAELRALLDEAIPAWASFHPALPGAAKPVFGDLR